MQQGVELTTEGSYGTRGGDKGQQPQATTASQQAVIQRLEFSP